MSEILQEFRAAISSRYIIGRGGMATVCLAQDTRHRRAVALKILQQDPLPSTTSERFHREIEIRLKDQRLEWDSRDLRFTNNDQANELLKVNYREGWTL